MKANEMRTLIEQYIRTQVRGKKEKDLYTKWLLGEGDTSFISLWEEYDGDINTAVREAVKGSTSSKSDVLTRYRRFINWLERRTGETYSVEWPPVDVGNRFERMIYMMRELQKPTGNVAQYLSDKLWISTRTIEDDLSSMYGDVTEENTLLNQSLTINGMKRYRGTIDFVSTVHPVLLLENLTCMTLLLHALLEKSENPACEEWTMTTAAHVWNQLTDYAKGRILKATKDMYGDDSSVLKRLEKLETSGVDNYFLPEEKFNTAGSSQLTYCMKADIPCHVVYQEEDGDPPVSQILCKHQIMV